MRLTIQEITPATLFPSVSEFSAKLNSSVAAYNYISSVNLMAMNHINQIKYTNQTSTNQNS